MVLVSATMYFPEQARAITAQVPSAADQPPAEWDTMRKRHKHGDEQTVIQAQKTARLPIIEGHVALMPDAHLGKGATIGSVIPTSLRAAKVMVR